MSEQSGSVRIIKASNKLQAKIGTGEVAAARIEATQHSLENNKIDFEPMAVNFLSQLETAVKQTQTLKDAPQKQLLHGMVKPVMELKANAEMFGYPLVTELANIMLNFLESIEKLDNDVIAIVDAHRKTLMLIIKGKMSGAVGDKGDILVQELRGACARYYAKKDKA